MSLALAVLFLLVGSVMLSYGIYLDTADKQQAINTLIILWGIVSLFGGFLTLLFREYM